MTKISGWGAASVVLFFVAAGLGLIGFVGVFVASGVPSLLVAGSMLLTALLLAVLGVFCALVRIAESADMVAKQKR